MPHLDLHFNPHELNAAEVDAMVAELCDVLRRHLNTPDESISAMLTQVTAADWKQDVYDPLIKPQLEKLYKRPGYRL